MATEIIATSKDVNYRGLEFTQIQPWKPPKMTNTEATRIVRELQGWVRQFSHPDAIKMGDALKDLESLFVRVWTEIDEALSQLSSAEYFGKKGMRADAAKARETAMFYLHRWQDRGGRIGNAGPR